MVCNYSKAVWKLQKKNNLIILWGVRQMLTMADKGGRGVEQMLTLSNRGGKGSGY